MRTSFKQNFSESSGGKRILVAETSTPGDLIHTCTSNPQEADEITLYADNIAEAAVILTVEYGDATAPMEVSLAANSGPVKILDALQIDGNATPKTIKAFAATGDVVSISGYVNRLVR